MGRRRKLFRTGLLVFLFVLFVSSIFAQEEQGETEEMVISAAANELTESIELITELSPVVEVVPVQEVIEVIEVAEEVIEEVVVVPRVLEIHVESSPANPLVNNPWTFVIMVNYPNPSFVNIRPPEIPSSLQMDNRVRVEARIFRGERWTRFEYTFISRSSGTFTLDPFIVTVPELQAQTARTSVTYREAPVTVRRYDPRFFWLNTEFTFHQGQRGELHLELRDWNPDLVLPRGIFHGRAPVNAILTENPPVESANNTYRYTINIIPLDENQITLESFVFVTDAHNLTVPILRVPVLAALPQNPPLTQELTQDYPEPLLEETEAALFVFPHAGKNVFFPLQNSYDNIVRNIEELWTEGRRGEALAEVRRNERDSFAGVYLGSLRLEMEQILGLGFTEDENWRPLRIHPLSWFISVFLIIFTGIFLLIYRPRKRRKSVIKNYSLRSPVNKISYSSMKGLKIVFIYFLIIGFSYIFFEEGVRQFLLSPLDSTKSGIVVERTAAHIIPDFNSGVNTVFNEGQPLSVGELRGEWHYAESNDGRSGWIHYSSVITY